jgi:hypothetical protein
MSLDAGAVKRHSYIRHLVNRQKDRIPRLATMDSLNRSTAQPAEGPKTNRQPARCGIA